MLIIGGALPLRDFKPKQIGKIGRPKKKKSIRSGVKVTVIKGRRQLIRSTEAGAMRSGHTEVFIRSTEKTMKGKPGTQAIFELYGPDVTQLVYPKSSNKQIVRYIQETFSDNYRKRLAHEVERALK